jgi:formamidopyrimidine-DNA glycosylase
MPELPEIEVLRRSLEPLVVGSRIESVKIWNEDLREPVDRRRLARCRGREIVDVRRRAKYLLLDLSNGQTLVVHLGMSGRLTLVPAAAPREPHEHLAFFLDSDRRLRYRDTRRFGLVLLVRTAGLQNDRHFIHLGAEPLEEGLTGAALRETARGRRGPIKSFLMDGRIIVGVGNIYAAEALHRAGIHPRRSVARISEVRWERLSESIRQTLTDAIAQGGTTLTDFADARGESGYFSVSLSVYDRSDQPCPRCRTLIRRIVQSGRSTFYCPGCQR